MTCQSCKKKRKRRVGEVQKHGGNAQPQHRNRQGMKYGGRLCVCVLGQEGTLLLRHVMSLTVWSARPREKPPLKCRPHRAEVERTPNEKWPLVRLFFPFLSSEQGWQRVVCMPGWCAPCCLFRQIPTPRAL